MNNKTPIYGYLWHTDTISIHNWVDKLFDDMILVQSFNELENCEDSIIFLGDVDANADFDLTKKLLDQNNFFIFSSLGESFETSKISNLINDLPQVAQFPMINGSSTRNEKVFGVETFIYNIFSLDNILAADTIANQNKTKRPYDFLFLNGRHQFSRQKIREKLLEKNLLEKSLYSYIGFDSKNSDAAAEQSIERKFLPREYESKIAVDCTNPIFQSNARNKTAFTTDIWRGQWLDGQLNSINKYTDTYFSLVTETLTDGPELFITEKTFKVLLAGHPFIILGQPGLYSRLHELGFKTFDNLINESFDSEVNLLTRIDLIVKQVERLCSSDLDKFAESCKDICQYNRKHYMNVVYEQYKKTHIELTNWVDVVINKGKQYISSNRRTATK